MDSVDATHTASITKLNLVWSFDHSCSRAPKYTAIARDNDCRITMTHQRRKLPLLDDSMVIFITVILCPICERVACRWSLPLSARDHASFRSRMSRGSCDAVWDRTLSVLCVVCVCFYFLLFFFLVATLIAFPFLSGFGSSRRFLPAALARPFLPSACALACGKHLGLPSESLPLAHGPLILPSGPNLTHFCLNHFLRSSVMNSCARIYLLLLLPQLLAPTFLHFANAPEAYAEGQTLYRDFTLW